MDYIRLLISIAKKLEYNRNSVKIESSQLHAFFKVLMPSILAIIPFASVSINGRIYSQTVIRVEGPIEAGRRKVASIEAYNVGKGFRAVTKSEEYTPNGKNEWTTNILNAKTVRVRDSSFDLPDGSSAAPE